MKKILIIFMFAYMFFSTNVFAGKSQMVEAVLGIPGINDASWQGSSSFWVVMSDPLQDHPYDQYGSMICNGSVSNFSVPKGYTITFWNIYTKKPINKFRCY